MCRNVVDLQIVSRLTSLDTLVLQVLLLPLLKQSSSLHGTAVFMSHFGHSILVPQHMSPV